MDDFNTALSKLLGKDKDERLEGMALLEEFIAAGSESNEPELLPVEAAQDLLGYVDGWIQDTNFKIAQGALNVLSGALLMTEDITVKPFVSSIVPVIIERLGDGRQLMRTAAMEALHGVLRGSTPESVVGYMKRACTHKNWRAAKFIGDEAEIRADIGDNLPADEVIAIVAPLLEDGQAAVKDATIGVVRQLYEQIGDQITTALQHTSIRPKTLQNVFDKLKGSRVRDGVTASPASSFQVQTDAPKPKPPSLSQMKAHVMTEKPTPRQRIGGISRPRSATSDRGVEATTTDKLEPLHVSSDRNLQDQLDTIKDTIGTSSAKWDTRVVSLHQFARLLVGDGSTRSGVILDALKSMRSALEAQLTDLRSKVQVEACLVIAALSETLGDSFAPHAEFFLPVLMKLTIISIQVVTENAHYATTTMITNVTAPRVITQLIEVLSSSRSSIQRQRCMQYILLCLESWDSSGNKAMQRTAEHTERMIMKELSAAESEVRQYARKVYWSFNRHWPERAAKLMGRLDPSSVKHLNDDGMSGSGSSGSLNLPGRSSAASHPIPRRTVSRTSTITQPVSARPISAPHHDNLRQRAATAAVLQDDSRRPAQRVPTVRKATVTSGRSAAGRSHSSVGGATRVMAGPQRVHVKPSASPSSENKPERSVSSISHHIEIKPLSVLIPIAESLSTSSPWTRRTQVYTDLRKSVAEGGADAAAIVIDKLLHSAIDRASDSHPKVAAAVLDLITTLISLQSSMLKNVLEQLMPIVCIGLYEGGPHQKSSNTCLNTIIDTYDAEAILTAILSGRSLDQPGNKTVQIGVMSTLIKILPAAKDHIGTTKVMRTVIDKLLPLLQSRLSELRTHAVDVFAALFAAQSHIFAATLATMPFMVLQDVKRFLGTKAPGLDGLIADARSDTGRNTSRTHGDISRRSPSRSKPPPSSPVLKAAPPSALPSPHRRDTPTSPPTEAMDEEWEKLNKEEEEIEEVTEVVDEPDTTRSVQPTTEEWGAITPSLISTLMGKGVSDDDLYQRRAALHAIARMSTCDEAVHVMQQHFGQVLLAVLQCVTDEVLCGDGCGDECGDRCGDNHDQDEGIRIEAIKVVSLILEHQTDLLKDADDDGNLLRVVVDSLIQLRGTEQAPQVLHTIDEALTHVAQLYDLHTCLDIIMPMVQSGVGAVVAPSVRLLTKVLSRVSDETLSSLLDTILPGLFEAFNNEVAEARKAVVFCLVDVYMKLGDQLTPFLASLSTTQLKLVTIYINRHRKGDDVQ